MIEFLYDLLTVAIVTMAGAAFFGFVAIVMLLAGVGGDSDE